MSELEVDRRVQVQVRAEPATADVARLLELVDTVDGVLWEADPVTFQFTFVSRRAEGILGYPVAAWLESPTFWADHIHPEDRAWAVAFCVDQTRAARDHTFEYRMLRADGRTVWIRDVVYVAKAADGRVVGLRGLMTDVTARKAAEADLAGTKRRLELVLACMSEGVYGVDASGVTTFVNDVGLRMLGLTEAEAVGRRLHDVIHRAGADGAPCRADGCPLDRANAPPWPVKDQRDVFCRKDGTSFPVEYNLAPMEHGGERLGAVLEVRDVTEKLRAERELQERADRLERLAEALERSNRELDQFAYVTSHDLKAPLRGIANLATWAEEDLREVTPEAKRHFELLRGRVRRMEALIDAILEYSRAGRRRDAIQEVDTGRLVEEVADLVAPPEGFRVDIAPGLPTLRTDRTRLQQVFLNLIANALKHHDRAEGRVSVSVEDAGDRWRFSVADDGPGIPPEFHERVFVMFQTLQPRDKVEGTGIGLALVKKIVESQGGSVELHSSGGRGCTFRFTWPKEPPQDRRDAP